MSTGVLLQARLGGASAGASLGCGETDREGVSPDDTCFGRFSSDLRFRPVTADVLSTGLPPVEQ